MINGAKYTGIAFKEVVYYFQRRKSETPNMNGLVRANTILANMNRAEALRRHSLSCESSRSGQDRSRLGRPQKEMENVARVPR